MQPLRILAALFFIAAISTAAGAIHLHESAHNTYYSNVQIYDRPLESPTADAGIVLGLCIVSAVCCLCCTWLAVTLFKSNEK